MRRLARRARAALLTLAMACAFTPACSRTGLEDDDLLFPPGRHALAADAGVGEPGDAIAADTGAAGEGPDSASSGDDGGSPLFSNDDSSGDDASSLSDGNDSDGGSGGGGCGPATCRGCCTAEGLCVRGVNNQACGNGGQACEYCDVERICSVQGVCG